VALTLARGNHLVITCEHGGRKVPRAYATLFSVRKGSLDSHRGWVARTAGARAASAAKLPF